MKYVKRQAELIHDLLNDLLAKTNDMSYWTEMAIYDRVDEAKAIAKAAQALVELVRQAKPIR